MIRIFSRNLIPSLLFLLLFLVSSHEVFAQTTYNLSVYIQGSGSGVVKSVPDGLVCNQNICTGTFLANTDITLKAVPGPGSFHTNWNGCVGRGNPCTISLFHDTNITVDFTDGFKASSINAAAIRLYFNWEDPVILNELVLRIEDVVSKKPVDIVLVPEFSLSQFEGDNQGSPPIKFSFDSYSNTFFISPNQENNRVVPIIEQVQQLARDYNTYILLGTVMENYLDENLQTFLIVDNSGSIVDLRTKHCENCTEAYQEYSYPRIKSYTLKTQQGAFANYFFLICAEAWESPTTEAIRSKIEGSHVDLFLFPQALGDINFSAIMNAIQNGQSPDTPGWSWSWLNNYFIPIYIYERNIIKPKSYVVATDFFSEQGNAGIFQLDSNPQLLSSFDMDDPENKWVWAKIPISTLKGDLNDDNSIDVLDIMFLIQEIFKPDVNIYYDVNGDYKVNLLDIIELINIIFS
ncbi:hypothetical protein COV24_01885 [candidate division WWE3 bacterium CG10_big_fil_rev_8_21_14_0_10_32_10]|uniref:Dockerin domain-containing protein n=1 Tax=candidate division WWE3 bacterium CG10_big_fil_rev_8_21_14_0_10_32_10 TaxID=1975090 RepID=A0A2H0RAJ3_UNCKA|nr:MAG: hypothetical protein COV24_01885 [candidate division WWE3 bacterium CG10_big_fil_rev_8_21_14_0_10_32_10]